jgi:hypothetical protein
MRWLAVDPLMLYRAPVHELDQLVDLTREHHHADPVPGQLPQQAVQIPLGVQVDAPRRIVEQKDGGADGEPPRHHDLLLIASAEGRDGEVCRGELDREPVPVAAQAPVGPRPAEHSELPIDGERRRSEVVADGQGGEQRLRPAIAGYVGDANRGCLLARPDGRLRVVVKADDLSLGRPVGERSEERVLPMAFEAGQTDHLAGSQREVDRRRASAQSHAASLQ